MGDGAASRVLDEGDARAKRSAEAFERARVRQTLRARMFGSEPAPLSLGRYRIDERIGVGGTSLVYRGYDPELDRAVAIKLVAAFASEPRRRQELRMRLQREGRALARLAHPALVRVYDVGFDGQLSFLALELVEGRSLEDWLGDERGWREVLEVMLPVGDALSAAHAEGLLHRDVKPANILLDARGAPRLVDFGFANDVANLTPLASADGPASGTATARVGTPAYMAPEQWELGSADPLSDQFAYCVTLYEALYGARPFDDTSEESLRASLREQAPIGADDARVPGWLAAIVRRGLAYQPAARFDSIEELLAEIRAHQQSESLTEAAELTVGRMRREADAGRRRDLGGSARSQLDSALAQWPDNPQARAALDELVRAQFEEALARRDLDDAASLLGSLPAKDEALEAQLAIAREEAAAPARRLAALERDRDPSVESKFKARTLWLSAATWTIGYLLYVALHRFNVLEVTPWTLLPLYVVHAASIALALRALPAKYASNRVNRETTLAGGACTVAHALSTLGCAIMGAPLAVALMFAHVSAAVAYGITGLAYDRKILWLTPVNLVGAALIVVWPAASLEIASGAVILGSGGWALMQQRQADA